MIYEKYRNTRIKEPLFLFNIEAEAFFLNISLISEYTDSICYHLCKIWHTIPKKDVLNTVYSVMSNIKEE